MEKFLRRLSAVLVVALATTVLVTIATPGVSSAECEGGRTWDPVAKQCDPPPPVPAWYRAAPSYAQAWAPPWAPPPPPAPGWAQQLQLTPVWDPRLEAWTWTYVR
jgi:hypothetical protein